MVAEAGDTWGWPKAAVIAKRKIRRALVDTAAATRRTGVVQCHMRH